MCPKTIISAVFQSRIGVLTACRTVSLSLSRPRIIPRTFKTIFVLTAIGKRAFCCPAKLYRPVRPIKKQGVSHTKARRARRFWEAWLGGFCFMSAPPMKHGQDTRATPSCCITKTWRARRGMDCHGKPLVSFVCDEIGLRAPPASMWKSGARVSLRATADPSDRRRPCRLSHDGQISSVAGRMPQVAERCSRECERARGRGRGSYGFSILARAAHAGVCPLLMRCGQGHCKRGAA